MDELKKLLLQDPGNNIRGKEFLNEAIQWLDYVDWLAVELSHCSDLGRRNFLLNDITVNYMTILNWVIVINKKEEHLQTDEMIEFLSKKFEWPNYICELFYKAVRNPTSTYWTLLRMGSL